MPSLPDHWQATDEATGEHPFRMVAGPARQFLNSTFSQVAESRRREVRPSVLMHPGDAARLGVADGRTVEIGNRRGTVALHARLSPGMQPGVVVVESVWPAADFAGGIGINSLISAQAAAPAGGAVFHDTAVWVRAA
jgi:anaerobic selenocysteine-containing dehydrogenase